MLSACGHHGVDTGTQAVTESLCTRVTMTLMSVKNHDGQGTAVILDRSH